MDIDWNKDGYDSARLSVSDGVHTNYVSEGQLPDEFTMLAVAEQYASGYDFSGGEEYAVCIIEDLADGEYVRFAFNAGGDFEWRTDRQFNV